MSCLRKRFNCLENGRQYSTGFLTGICSMYGINSTSQSSSHKCNISGCVKRHRNLQGFQKRVKREHKWFFEKYMIILGDSWNYMPPILFPSSAKRIATQMLATEKLSGRKYFVLRGFVCDIIRPSKKLPVQS